MGKAIKYPLFGANLRWLRDSKGLSQTAFAKELGEERGAYAMWEGGYSRPEPQVEKAIAVFCNTTIDALYNMDLSKPENLREANITYAPDGKLPRAPRGAGNVPFFDADFEAGTGVAFYDDIRSSKPAYTMDVPEFAGCTAFRTYGKSMQPLIDSGAILFGSEEKNWQNSDIEYGQIFGIVLHAIDGVTKRYLKTVRRSLENPKTHYRLQSVNPLFDEMELDKSLIKSMWLIHGWINKNT